MNISPDIAYTLEALFAAFGITFWFVLLFGFIAPLFLSHTKDLPPIEKLLYSWVGLGGVIIITVFVLTLLHIYDFISFILTLLLIPLVLDYWKHRDKGILGYLSFIENRLVVSQLKRIENFDGFGPGSIKSWFTSSREKKYSLFSQFTVNTVAILIAVGGGLVRMYPALNNASPFSREWYYQLNRIKNLRLQEYFGLLPEEGGMHALVSVFSMLTQLSPEMILHLLGAMTSFFLCIIIFWVIKDITKNKQPVAALFGMSIYAITPMLFMPLSLDQQIEANSLDLALCLAIPTLTIFTRNIRSRYKSPWFYVLSGFIAVGMINYFVAFVVLLPFLIMAALGLPRRRYFKTLFKVIVYLGVMSLIILGPVLYYWFFYDIEIYTFWLEQLYNTRAYSYYPSLYMSLETLAIYYLGMGLLFLGGYLARLAVIRKIELSDELIFMTVFSLLSYWYSPFLQMDALWIDLDQLNAFYALLIGIFGGVAFSSLLQLLMKVTGLKPMATNVIATILFIFGLGGALYLQNGLSLSRVLPVTVPNGYYQSYYRIIEENLPYSYATVGPEIERINAKNRHYFMNYGYFLNQYGSIDSLYHEQLLSPESKGKPKQVPPASIFIFMVKPPFGSIQQGILYDASTVMRDLEQWLNSYREMKGRTLKKYYEDAETVVYQIINREKESRVEDVLYNIHPNENRRGILDE